MRQGKFQRKLNTVKTFERSRWLRKFTNEVKPKECIIFFAMHLLGRNFSGVEVLKPASIGFGFETTSSENMILTIPRNKRWSFKADKT